MHPFRRVLRVAGPIALLGVLAGCCPGKSDQQRAAEASAALAKLSAEGKGTLSLAPATLRECDLKSGGKVVEVRWDARKSGTNVVKVLVKGPHDPEKVWTAGGAMGADKTGPWVVPGTTFTLTDGADQPLAQTIIQSKPCTD